MKNIHTWLSEYGESHQNHTNKIIHWICVPVIFFSITALLYSIKLPWPPLNVAIVVLAAVILYYLRLSVTIALGMLLFSSLCLVICHWMETVCPFPLWASALVLFALAWVGQFYGHSIEGKKPSFLKDVQFLMIGPAWLMSFIFKKWGIRI
ncbi:MAG TPA: hypothetical protein DEU93_02495 [Chitinophagaceae bacterium]|nr:hypothetical protein [Chitinophagaceae bacterium]HML57394.1 DUF962 domain-containing protein [Ferruginibacter sp.]